MLVYNPRAVRGARGRLLCTAAAALPSSPRPLGLFRSSLRYVSPTLSTPRRQRWPCRVLNARPRKARRLWPTKSSARGRIDKIRMVSLLLFRGPSLLASAVPHVNLKLRLSEGSAADSRPCAFELEGHAYELGALAFNVAKDDGRDGGRQRRLACLHTDRQTASTFGSAHGAFAPRPTGKPIHITIRA